MQTCNEISCLYVHACTHGYACAHMHIYAACSMLLLVRLFSGAIYSLMHCPIPHLVTVTGCAVCSSSPSSAKCCCPSRGCAAASCSCPSRGCGCSGGRSCAPHARSPTAGDDGLGRGGPFGHVGWWHHASCLRREVRFLRRWAVRAH